MWESKKLGDVCTFLNGFAFKSKDAVGSSNVQLLRMGNLYNNELQLDRKPVFYPDSFAQQHSKFLLQQGDLVMSLTGTVGKRDYGFVVKIPDDTNQLLLNQRIAKFIEIDETLVNKEFLLRVLHSKTFLDELYLSANGTRQANLSTASIKSIEIPLPPLETQKQIVAKLDQVFADIEKAKANAEQNLKNARELFESYFQQVCNQSDDWHEKELGDVCNFLNGYAFKSKDAVDESDTQLIRMGNLYQNQLNLDRKPSFYPSSYASEYEKFTLREGDLVMSLTGTVDKEDYGYTVEIPRFDGSLLLNQRIVKFIEIDETLIERRFLFRILRSRIFLDKLYESANGTRQANLSTVTMKKLKILVPNILRQKELIDIFDNLEQEIKTLSENYKFKIQALDELKQSILQKAFNGELA
jgi:type I restriction enzyme S subunit